MMINLVCIPKAMISDLMDKGLRELGWTDEQVYDDIKHKVLGVPRKECQSCYVSTDHP